MRAQPPHTRSDRAWVSRWLEVTTASLKELHLMRQEAEEKVRGVLEEKERSEKRDRDGWQGMGAEESMAYARWKNLEMDQTKPRSLELAHIQEEALVRLRKCKLENFQEMTPPQDIELDYSSESSCFKQAIMADLVEGLQAKVHTRKWSVESPRPAKTILEQPQENSIHLPQSLGRQNQAPADTSNQRWLSQSSIWTRTDGQELDKTGHNVDKTVEQSEEREPLFSVFATEPASLRRIGSGSLAPRLRLGSSGVTSDLLFTRRMSAHSSGTCTSGFYETSDLDSTSSSCSSLCSDISCHTSVSLMSPHRSSGMRPRSIDCSLERRKELQSGMSQTKRPMSAGALDGYSLRSSNSQFDLVQTYDVPPCDYPYSGTPPLCAIQQRQKAERYICKLALKYRCKPGTFTVRPDFGPQTPRRPAQVFLPSSSHVCLPSPQISSLSSSLVDVRKHSTGSWGRFLSRVMLKKESRIAASEMNLEQCGKSSRDTLRSPSLAEGQFTRAKSFRDLLSVKPFKRSQRGLNKAW
ncbi:uncharacterized protein LOC120980047 [Bufo bufo]|uniref:uncharacterized protein LOC120980047 n=1 Tax=Bufo bufo TaxID=8384 RepID=UPI001ABE3BC1|nr:uncharacterized protein LOC120980047 [Bufo bufo]